MDGYHLSDDDKPTQEGESNMKFTKRNYTDGTYYYSENGYLIHQSDDWWRIYDANNKEVFSASLLRIAKAWCERQENTKVNLESAFAKLSEDSIEYLERSSARFKHLFEKESYKLAEKYKARIDGYIHCLLHLGAITQEEYSALQTYYPDNYKED